MNINELMAIGGASLEIKINPHKIKNLMTREAYLGAHFGTAFDTKQQVEDNADYLRQYLHKCAESGVDDLIHIKWWPNVGGYYEMYSNTLDDVISQLLGVRVMERNIVEI